MRSEFRIVRREALRFRPRQLFARRRLPVLGFLVALGVAIERALEIAEGDDETRPAVLEAALEDVVLVKIVAGSCIDDFFPITPNAGIRRTGGLKRIYLYAWRIDPSGLLFIDISSEPRLGQTQKLDTCQRVET